MIEIRFQGLDLLFCCATHGITAALFLEPQADLVKILHFLNIKPPAYIASAGLLQKPLMRERHQSLAYWRSANSQLLSETGLVQAFTRFEFKEYRHVAQAIQDVLAALTARS